jgi:hypothetical protein
MIRLLAHGLVKSISFAVCLRGNTTIRYRRAVPRSHCSKKGRCGGDLAQRLRQHGVRRRRRAA